MKHMLHLGSLKPDKVKKDKKTMHAKGHMPAGADDTFGMRKGKPNNFVS